MSKIKIPTQTLDPHREQPECMQHCICGDPFEFGGIVYQPRSPSCLMPEHGIAVKLRDRDPQPSVRRRTNDAPNHRNKR
jgi:hypothetical protein